VEDRQIFVTTSWDDGHVLDTKMADLLASHGCKGTFYVSPKSHEIRPSKRISKAALRDVDSKFEVGGHTLTHPHLTRVPPSVAVGEITDGKHAVEDVIGHAITSFCYPYGAYRPEHVEMVGAAGFRVGRTIRRFNLTTSADPLQMPTTTHAVRRRADGWQVARRTASPVKVIRMWRHWDVLARRVFEEAQERGGVIHIWGHSWEIEKNSDWERLSSLLGELAGYRNATMVTNGELGELMRPPFADVP
jgi:peptidoglycan/xylan/chitin deacetylase (PgdA/CDA1 family)